MSSFTSLGLIDVLTHQLTELGYQSATPIQAQAIPAVLANKDVMAGAQTGTGKTAAFALPILQQIMLAPHNDEESPISTIPSIKALVLTPTRELAQQVFTSFESYAEQTNINIAVAYGGVSINPQIKALERGVDVLVATPGRLLDLLIKGSMVLGQVKHIVFDEADRMLDLGFKDEIQRILNRMPPERQTLLFSATFDDAIFKLSKKLLVDPELIEVAARNTAAETVEQKVYNVDKKRKRELTSYLIGKNNWQQVLVFTRTKQGADELAAEMVKDGIAAVAIHGDKSQGARDKALTGFKEGKVRALVATDVAARGLDIQALNVVINYELPFIAEDYIHRIGRTGRAGNDGLAISLFSAGEEELLTAVEEVLNTRLMQQWYPGYEPSLDLSEPTKRPNRGRDRQKARKKALSGDNNRRRRARQK